MPAATKFKSLPYALSEAARASRNIAGRHVPFSKQIFKRGGFRGGFRLRCRECAKPGYRFGILVRIALHTKKAIPNFGRFGTSPLLALSLAAPILVLMAPC